jgi:hypothetical protein
VRTLSLVIRAVEDLGHNVPRQHDAATEVFAMNELERLDALLRERSAFLAMDVTQRRAASDALGDMFPLAADVRVEPVTARERAWPWPCSCG